MSDLTTEEQINVRTALRHLRIRCGGWKPLAQALHFETRTLRHAVCDRGVSAAMAFRVARFVGVSIDDLLAGKYPASGACPYCGHVVEPSN